MSGIFVFMATPAAGAQVGRRLHVAGSIGAFKGSIFGMSIRFPHGETFGVNAPSTGPFGVTSGGWSWDGEIPKSVRPGEPFVISVTASGSLETRGFPEPEFEDVDGEATATLWLEYVVPTLSVTPFQSVAVTTGETYTLQLGGAVSEGSGDPYYPRLQYQIGGAAAVDLGVVRGPWNVPVPLAPGTYPISVTVKDNYDSVAWSNSTLTVYKYAVPPEGIPTTASVTSWTRLEPHCARADLEVTTRARLFDPLWLMTRQWQVGEFQGEDAGSPVQARVRATNAALSRYHPGELSATSASSAPYRSSYGPLEALAERRAMRPARPTDLRMLPLAVDAGLHFLRMLELDLTAAKYRPAFLAKYALPPLTTAAAAAADADTVRFVAGMAGRAPDARLLAPAFRAAATLAFEFDPALAVAAVDKVAVQKVAVAWLAIYNGLFSEPRGAADDAWLPSRLEYGLSVSTRFSALAADDLTFTASEFDGGRLDWSSFDVNGRFKLDTTGDKPFTAITALALPAHVSFKGAPAPRFWELEDAKVAYGLMSVGPTDLAHLMMIEYASSYGNDWYVVALTVPVGSVTRVDSLVVTDTFGVRSLLRPIGDPALKPAYFSMWQASEMRFAGDDRPSAVPNAFFLPPTIGRSLDGEPLEDVLFMRDEMANLAWGIERTIESGSGTAVSLANGAPPAPDPAPHYVLSSLTPENWVPLMPVEVDDRGTVQLKRAATLQLDGTTKPRAARSAVLNAAANLMLYDEEIPREGVRITRRRRMARWIDGSTWVWTAFRNEVGRGEGSAGLRFDQTGEAAPPS